MTFAEAIAYAKTIDAKLPRYGADAPVAQCWIDRIELACMYELSFDVAGMMRARDDANRYAG